MEDINRIKMVLFEKKKTARWLAGEMGVTPSTVSKWCTNSSQPDLATINRDSRSFRCRCQDTDLHKQVVKSKEP